MKEEILLQIKIIKEEISDLENKKNQLLKDIDLTNEAASVKMDERNHLSSKADKLYQDRYSCIELARGYVLLFPLPLVALTIIFLLNRDIDPNMILIEGHKYINAILYGMISYFGIAPAALCLSDSKFYYKHVISKNPNLIKINEEIESLDQQRNEKRKEYDELMLSVTEKSKLVEEYNDIISRKQSLMSELIEQLTKDIPDEIKEKESNKGYTRKLTLNNDKK